MHDLGGEVLLAFSFHLQQISSQHGKESIWSE